MWKQINLAANKILPINRNELTKFLYSAILIFLISYIYNILLILKDTLIISYLGAEYISSIRLWVALPTSFIFMLAYIKLADKFNRAQLFHIVSWFFIACFVLFAFLLYPNREGLSIGVFNMATQKFPSFKYVFTVIRYWHFGLFFVLAENWGIVMFSISFWQIANHITTYEQSKRFYPLFGGVAQIGMFLGGLTSAAFITDNADWQLTLNKITTSITVAGLALSLCLAGLQNTVGYYTFNTSHKPLNVKAKTSMKESLKYILSSKAIFVVTALVTCYYATCSLVEVSWNKAVEIYFHSDVCQIHRYFCKVNGYKAILSLIFAIICSYMLRKYRWRTSTLVTPIVILITGGIFLLAMWSKNMYVWPNSSSNHLWVIISLGTISVVFIHSLKHTLFDSTKEMIYIPLDDELKTKGKAVAETFGSRVGRAGVSVIHQVLFSLFPLLNLISFTPVIFVIFLAVSILWLLILFSRNYRNCTPQ
jgi:ATP:ADP antiporter, AAA family